MILIHYTDRTVFCNTVFDVVRDIMSYYGLNNKRFMHLYRQISKQHEIAKSGIFMRNTDLALFLEKI